MKFSQIDHSIKAWLIYCSLTKDILVIGFVLEYQHSIAKAVEAIAKVLGLFISLQDEIFAGEG